MLDSFAADDFVNPNTWSVDTVKVRVSISPTNPSSVIFYNNGAGNLPGSTTECSRTSGNSASSSGGANNFVLTITLSSACSIPAGTHWVNVYTTGTIAGGLLTWASITTGTATTAPRAGSLRYRMQSVALDGTRAWLGSTVAS